MVYWIPWPQKHKNRHQDHRNRMSFSRFIVKNVFWWRPSLISNFRREPLECRRVSRDFWNLHTQNPPRAKFHASFRKCTPNSHIRPTIALCEHQRQHVSLFVDLFFTNNVFLVGCIQRVIHHKSAFIILAVQCLTRGPVMLYSTCGDSTAIGPYCSCRTMSYNWS